ncbi:hypothetical protein D3C74_410310 [compost metagenome]
MNAGKITASRRNEQTVTTFTLDPGKLVEMLQLGGERSVVTIPFNDGSDVVIGELNGHMIKMMEEFHAVLEIKSEKLAIGFRFSKSISTPFCNELGRRWRLKTLQFRWK